VILGSGCSSIVKVATDLLFNREVALKIIKTDDYDLREELKKEHLLLKKLDHPGVVKTFNMVEENVRNTVYISFQKIAGQTLKDLVHNNNILSRN
jgi:serine/threonine protein kinase